MRHALCSTLFLALLALPALAAAEEPAETQASLEVAAATETLGPIDVRLTLGGYRVRLDHRQVEALVEMSEYAELAAAWSESDLVAQIVWLARAQLAAFCAVGNHAGVEVKGGWTDVPAIRPR